MPQVRVIELIAQIDCIRGRYIIMGVAEMFSSPELIAKVGMYNFKLALIDGHTLRFTTEIVSEIDLGIIRHELARHR